MIRRIPPCGAGAFLSDQKGTKESLGAAFDERLRGAGAHRRRSLPPLALRAISP